MRRTFTVFIVGVVLLGLWAGPSFAQAPKPDELKPSVPALDAMHDVIMPLWHDAWPKKDAKAMAELLPGIEQHVAAVSAAELPGILRDKQAAWASQIVDLKATTAAYKAAVASGDNEALFKAAEKLHMQYEGLVRLVRPVLKEIEDFHATLYVLYHYQMSPFQLAKVSESIGTLKLKMDALNKATLPARQAAKTEAFGAQRARLGKSVDDVAAAIAGGDETKVKSAIELMHAEYENLERIF